MQNVSLTQLVNLIMNETIVNIQSFMQRAED